MRFGDIETIGGVRFLNVRGTKSRNAVRKVPIHPTLYEAIERHIAENGTGNETPIFGWAYLNIFRRASLEMGSMLGYSERELVEKGICFYSGRHSYKTVLSLGNATGIAELNADFAEMFMGHSSKAQLKKEGLDEYEYKHIKADRIGDSLLADKGRAVIKILSHYYL